MLLSRVPNFGAVSLAKMVLILTLAYFFFPPGSSFGQGEETGDKPSDPQIKPVSRQDNGKAAAPANREEKPAGYEAGLGKSLFKKNKCATCHSIDGEGGCLAPPLDGIRMRRDRTFIRSRITNTPAAIKEFDKLYGHQELMPHLRVPAHAADLIATYLLTIPEPKNGFRIVPHAKATVAEAQAKGEPGESAKISARDIASGKKLFYQHGCMTCHSIGHLGGRFAPSLDGIGARHTREYVSGRMTNAELMTQNYPDEYQQRGVVMPPTDLNPREIKQISEFLMSLPEAR